MEIKFLGTGGAFDIEDGNSSALVYLKDNLYLIDCGNTTYQRLRNLNLVNDITHILITHLHDDHIGSLCSLLLHRSKKINGDQKGKLTLIYPHQSYRDHLFAFLNFIMPNKVDQNVDFKDIKEFHHLDFVDNTGKHVPGMPSFSYLFKKDQKMIAYSGDLGDFSNLYNALKEYSKFSEIDLFHEVSFNKNLKVHSYYKDLEKFLSFASVYGYHCNSKEKPLDLKFPLVKENENLIF